MNELFHTLNDYLALFAVLVNFVYVILVLVRTSRTTFYIAFLLICLSNLVWNFGDFMISITKDPIWFYVSRIGSSMLPALMFHWINSLVMPERVLPKRVLLAYVFSGLLALLSFSAIFYPGIRSFVQGGSRSVLYLVLLGPFLMLGIGMILNAFRQAKLEDERRRLLYFVVAAIVGVFTGLTDLVRFLGIPVPPLGHLGCLVYTSVLAVGVFKHRTAYDILAQMRLKLEDLSQMAAGIAHEIRNPLTSIKGAADLLNKELKDVGHPACHEYCNLIREEVERISDILNNFQYFTKPLKIESTPVSINEVLQKTVKLAEVGTLNLEIKLQLSKDLPVVQADASLLKQVFLNLIKNAAEACGPGGELIARTESASPWIRVSFSDNGPGIHPEAVPHIFEPFYTTKATGMGVGLVISQRIIEAHHGRIEAQNGYPRGAQFSILLPL
jgi:signal transduction histidine kinase